MPKITTFFTFDNQAEEAARYYASIFDGGRVTNTTPGPNGTVMSVTFELAGQRFIAMNGGPTFSFAQGISLFVGCDTQAEIDHLWEKLTAGGGKEVQCGWLTDRFGVTWQIVPTRLGDLLGSPDPAKAGRAVQAMLEMKKLDIAALQRAHDGS
jgi:predicted 3-demethylubiquinone-9 3-methyltransferase (glyoxalase superfamily)